jgi:hypothetical protein
VAQVVDTIRVTQPFQHQQEHPAVAVMDLTLTQDLLIPEVVAVVILISELAVPVVQE